MKNKLIAAGLSLVMALSLVTTPAFAVNVQDAVDKGQADPIDKQFSTIGSMSNFKQVNVWVEGKFEDVSVDDWFHDPVQDVYEKGVMVGVSGSLFSPDTVVSLGQLMTMVARISNTYYGDNMDFSGGDPWYQPYVDYCIARGIIKEGQYTDFEQPATRLDMSLAFYNAMDVKEFEVTNPIVDDGIPDVSIDNPFAKEIYAMYRAGILVGVDIEGNFDSDGNLTRGQMATVVSRVIEQGPSEPEDKPEEKPDNKPEEKPEQKPEEKPDPKPEEKPTEPTEKPPVEQPEQPTEPENPTDTPDPKPEEKPEEKPQNPEGGDGEYDVTQEEIVKQKSVVVSGNMITVGDPMSFVISTMGTPDEKLPAVQGFTWNVYGISDYATVVAIGESGGKVVAVAAEGSGWTWNNLNSGDVFSDSGVQVDESLKGVVDGYLYADDNDGNKLHGVMLIDYMSNMAPDPDPVAFAGEAKLLAYMTNAFRVMHGQSALTWNDRVGEIALGHSDDMATRNFFEHTNPDGKNSFDRIYGRVPCSIVGENIVAGTATAIESLAAWVDSSGHRDNLLESRFTGIGIGGCAMDGSDYYTYWTQNFIG